MYYVNVTNKAQFLAFLLRDPTSGLPSSSSSSPFSSSSSSSSCSFGRIGFAVYREADMQASRLRSLSTRPPGAERPVVHVDPAIGKADGPHRKKLRTYLGIVARDKVDVTYENWKEVPTAQKDLIWEDIKVFFISYLILFN